ncbi:MAG: TonB-dependent receptor [Candidatus Cloacimonetes bacterium]|jgi:TonB-linked SusC/RagA family outer membrane protein|nr:TonB-dependent receptor [Candidatus Cloacimonadota bacterium]SFU47810.1 TonB-linked outer membrane protein, SusC/RagA family [Porphyromonadaceae bacterium KHP3R9]
MKKNSANEHFLNRSAIKNLIKIMKISLLLLFAIIFHATAADSNVKDAVIEPNRNVNDERQFIHEIETQSNYMPETDVRDENVREIFETGKALQQGKTVRGKVVDEQGTAVIGATVVVKDNPTHGTVTDVDGMFTIANLPENAVLVFTYVGMKPQEVSVAGTTSLNVVLHYDVEVLEEVVVVGYGTQRKVNLTGAVDQVSSDVFENRPITNMSQGLVGVIPNLNIQLTDGKPTNSPTYNIRGVTSIGQGGSALILVDGVEGDPRMLNPNDIESVSVLKDAASASIYGARAAFGVVLITTKQAAKGKTSLNYTGTFSSKRPTAVPDNIVDSYPWAQAFNDAWSRWNDDGRTPTAINKTMTFSPAYLEEIKRRWENPSLPRVEVNPVTGAYEYYYSTDWYKELYKNDFFAQDHNISMSGGNDLATFYLSGRYNGHEGLYKYNTDTYSMYNLRGRGSIQVLPWLNIDNNLEYSTMQYHQPINVGEGSNIWRNIADEGHPLAPLLNPDGTLSFSAAYTLGDRYLGKNGADLRQKVFKNKTAFTSVLLDKALTIKGDFTFQNTEYGHQRIRVPVPYSRYQGQIAYTGTNTNDLQERRSTTEYIATNLYANYVKSVNEIHNFELLGGFNYEQSVYNNLETTRNGVVYEDAKDINLALGSNIVTGGGYNKWRIAGGFARLNYNFLERYLLEVNGRYDGSSKFPSGQQWNFFPSISAAWRLSEEPFWKVDRDAISNLKLRVSYGSLGNGSINPYTFMENFSIRQSGRIIGDSRPQLTSQPSVIPNMLTWETSTTGNIGIDITALNNRLSFTGDIYQRWTDDMYTVGPSVPAVFGTSVPKGNYGSLETKGWEVSLTWMDRFNLKGKPFHYNVRLTLADSKTVITDYYNPDMNLTDYYVGQVIGEIWGYRVEGLFKSEEEIANSPSQSNILAHNTRRNHVGDLKFKNLDGDDVIYHGLNRVGNSGDKTIIGNNSPRYRFGINLGADWNRFFFNAFFNGVGKQQWYPSRESPFWGQYNRPYNDYPRWQENKQFRPELQNFDAYLPLLSGYTAQNANGQLALPNDRYLQNVAFIRLRTLNVGYTLPESITSKFAANNVKVYLSGENLWCWSPFYKITRDIDVENIWNAGTQLTGLNSDDVRTDGDGFNYPTLKAISLGLSINF